jgi:N-methylhydantoinase B
MFSGTHPNGEWFQLFQIGFGGIPGRPFGDGADGHSMWPNFTNVPNEFLERYFPMQIEEYSTVPDSGGAGKFRGGNGIKMSTRFLETGTIAIHDDRWFVPPWGVSGGQPGARSWKLLERANGGEKVYLPSKCDGIEVHKDDILHFVTWGGGGWGDPLERDPAIVSLEIVRGLVTSKGALDYGVVADDAGKVDEAATTALRAKMAAERPPIEVFNRGPSIEDLRASCLADTGLAAPVQPKWRKQAMKLAAE